MLREWSIVVSVMVLALCSCSGSKSDIDVTVTVDSAMLSKTTAGKLTGSITVTVALGSYAMASHTVTPSSVQAVVGTHIYSADLGSAPTYNPVFMPGETRSATFPISCGAADDCGAANVCSSGATADVDFLWADGAGTGIPVGQITHGTATVSCP